MITLLFFGVLLVAVAVCLVMGMTPVTAGTLGTPEFSAPTRVYPVTPTATLDALLIAARDLPSVSATRIGANRIVVDCRPSFRRLDDGFGLVAVVEVSPVPEGTRVTIAGRRKVKLDFQFRAERGLHELERGLRNGLKRRSNIRTLA